MCKEFRIQLLLIVALNLAVTGCNSSSAPPISTSNFLWVATQDDQMVRSYTIDHAKGTISPIGNGGSPVPTGQRPAAIALSPDRTTLFVANAGDNTLNLYVIRQDGTLNTAGLPVPAGGTSPKALAADTTNNLLFVADQGSDLISVFTMSPGLATFKTSFGIQSPEPSGGSGPVALAISPAGFSCTDIRIPQLPVVQKCFALYAANQTAGTITAYDYFVDLSGNFVRGAVEPSGIFVVEGTVSGSPYTAGTFPSALAFSRCAGAGANPAVSCQSAGVNGLFVANAESNDVTVFSACIKLPCQTRPDGSGPGNPDGSLELIESSVPAGTGPAALLVDPGGDFVYVVDSGSNQICAFSYTSSDGKLTQVHVTTPTGTFSGGAFTPNFGMSNWLVITGAQTLSAFGTGSDGSLTPASSPQFSGQPSAILIR